MRTQHLRGFSLRELLLFLALGLMVLVVLVGISFVIPARSVDHKTELDRIQLKDLMADLSSIQADSVRRKKLSNMPEVQGYKFYELALRSNVLRAETMRKLVSLSTKIDWKMDSTFFDDESIVFEPENCSWTAPKSTELLSLLAKSGNNRKVIICFNSRNWNNTSQGVLLQFSDGVVAEYFDYDLINDEYPDAISEEDWNNGQQGTIIGKVAPFDKTFD